MSHEPQFEKLTDHDYDGIQEYDNPLPGWWKWLFWLTIFFSIAYVGLFHIRSGQGIHDKYENRVAAHFAGQLERLGFSEPTNEAIVGLMQRDDVMSAMGGLFGDNCGQCHRADGGGNIGPNLTDNFYKNVKKPSDLFDVISNGVAGTSMPAWTSRLNEPQILMLAAYSAWLRESDPANPKAAEGSEIPRWSTFVDQDDETTSDSTASNEDDSTGP